MKIAIISVHTCPSLLPGIKNAGGMNVYLLEISKQLAKHGYTVDIFTQSHKPNFLCDTIPIADGIRIIHIDLGKNSQNSTKFKLLPYIPDFTYKVLKWSAQARQSYDLIFSHYWLSGLVGIELSKEWCVPHVTAFHTTAALKSRAQAGGNEDISRAHSEFNITQSADKILVWTNAEKLTISSLYESNPEKFLVLPPGINCDTFSPSRNSNIAYKNGYPTILFVGRLDRIKGLDILLSAMKLLEIPDVRLRIIGGNNASSERQRLFEGVKSNLLENRVEFINAMNRLELPNQYRKADLFIAPSYYESFGFAALEAAACGIPVIASNVDGLSKIVEDGQTGYLVNSLCPEHFAEKIDLLLANNALRKRMGIAARNKALSMQWDTGVQEMMKMFSILVENYNVNCFNGSGVPITS